MKRFRIIKVIFAKDIKEALLNDVKAEIVDVALDEEIDNPEVNIGFTQVKQTSLKK